MEGGLAPKWQAPRQQCPEHDGEGKAVHLRKAMAITDN